MWLLAGTLVAVFLATWAIMGTFGWAVLVAAVVLVGGAVLGASADID